MEERILEDHMRRQWTRLNEPPLEKCHIRNSERMQWSERKKCEIQILHIFASQASKLESTESHWTAKVADTGEGYPLHWRTPQSRGRWRIGEEEDTLQHYWPGRSEQTVVCSLKAAKKSIFYSSIDQPSFWPDKQIELHRSMKDCNPFRILPCCWYPNPTNWFSYFLDSSCFLLSNSQFRVPWSPDRTYRWEYSTFRVRCE